ncbi:MAG TPA: glycosyltransferase family 2 protein [Acidobacteriota bacterium]|nr:glycosyltransferase family 2 protein [Acidobacteriota bacterium]
MMYSFILPCRNEEKSVARCVDAIHHTMKGHSYEIIVSDSSSDSSGRIAKQHGATVVKHNKIGYGAAIMQGIAAASGSVFVIADCDSSYDFRDSLALIKKSRAGTLVIGKRSVVDHGAMPFFHRYVGTPLLSGFLSILFHQRITDNNSGFRVIHRKDFEALSCKTTGMEFASEMLVKSLLNRFKIVEVPIRYHVRVGKSKLSTWADGWRHLRFLIAYIPLNLFFLIGMISFLTGGALLLFSIGGQLEFLSITFYRSAALVASFLCYTGFSVLQVSFIAKIVLKQRGLGAEEKLLTAMAKIPFEIAMSFAVLVLLGFSASLGWIVYDWWFNQVVLNTNLLIFLLTGATISFQAFVSAFLVSFLLVETK